MALENIYLLKTPNIVLLTVLAGDGPLRTFLSQMTLKITSITWWCHSVRWCIGQRNSCFHVPWKQKSKIKLKEKKKTCEQQEGKTVLLYLSISQLTNPLASISFIWAPNLVVQIFSFARPIGEYVLSEKGKLRLSLAAVSDMNMW